VYREAVFKAERDYAAALEEVGVTPDREVTTYSSDDWLAVADIALSISRVMKAIEPPTWIELWHQLKIEELGMCEQIAKAAAHGGVFAAIAIIDQTEAMDARSDQLMVELSKVCDGFSAFVDDWENIDEGADGSTPVASPPISPSPE
jgi:hypothetical protein